jgi:hypothetical protein
VAAGHVGALTAITTNNTSQPSNESFSYPHTPIEGTTHQPSYTANGYAPQDWRQWTRTYAQMGQTGDYMNGATTLMTLGRDGGAHGVGNHSQTLVGNPGMQGHIAHHWPEISFPGATSHLGQH